jgi:Xaa-Pro aminopeptidase
MRHAPIDPRLFISNRDRLRKKMLPNSLAAVHANDVLPTTADGTLRIFPNSDLFYLTGVEQEESILLLAPQAADRNSREILFLRETNEQLVTWEGHKLTKEQAREISGVRSVRWLSEFPSVFHALMCDVEHVYLNTNEHKRAVVEVETRDARFIRDVQSKYPLHDYGRLARLMGELRSVKSDLEIDLIRKACAITKAGFERVCRFVKPGVNECEVEAEFAHEFIRNRASFAYNPIIASGPNANVLHYNDNDQPCKAGDLLLLDVAAAYANYNADLTRTIPVSGRFTPRQRKVYDAVLRVMRRSIAGAVVGKTHAQWQREAQLMMRDELLSLGLLKKKDLPQDPEDLAPVRKFFMHGLGHPLGLAVHDVGSTNQPFEPGMVLTVEPGIYLKDEGFGVRLENDIVVTENGPLDLMADIPVEAGDIEGLMRSKRKR